MDTNTISIEDEENERNHENKVLRRRERQMSRPKYLNDNVLIADEKGEMLLLGLNDDPINFVEASKLEARIEACVDEMQSIEKNEVWILVDYPAGVKPIGPRWIFKIKHNSDGSTEYYKTRLVAKGYVQQYGIYFDEGFSHVARLETIRLLVSISATNGW